MSADEKHGPFTFRCNGKPFDPKEGFDLIFHSPELANAEATVDMIQGDHFVSTDDVNDRSGTARASIRIFVVDRFDFFTAFMFSRLFSALTGCGFQVLEKSRFRSHFRFTK